MSTSAWPLAIILSIAGCGDDASTEETDGQASAADATTEGSASTTTGGGSSMTTASTSSSSMGEGESSAGSGPDSSTGDTTAGGDGSSSGGNPGDPCGGADVLCDDFEDGLDPAWAYTGAAGNMPSVDEAVARSGSQSLTFPSTDTQGAFV